MTPKALAFDLDGTLTVSKSDLAPNMGALLAQLTERMPVAVMSGGSYKQFERQFLDRVPEDANRSNLYLFPTSAAQCYAWDDGAWALRYSHPFTDDERERVMAALHEALHETGLDVPPPKLWGAQIEDRGSQITWSALGQEAPVDEKKHWDPDKKKRLPLQRAILARLSGFEVRVNASNSIDITKKGVSKAYGVRQFSDMLGVPVADMLYVGDALGPGGNDEIVKETGIPTHPVSGPDETAALVSDILASYS